MSPNHTLQAFAARAYLALAPILPRRLRRLAWVGLLGLLGPLVGGRSVRRQIGIAFGQDWDDRRQRRLARRYWRHVGRMLADLPLIRRGHTGWQDRWLDIDPSVDAVLPQLRQGAIVLSAHFGHWELLANWLCSSFERTGLAARQLANQQLSDLLNSLRTSAGGTMFPVGDPPGRAISHLRNGGILAILADQDIPRMSGDFIPFLGRDAHTPGGTALLALRAGVPLVPLFLVLTPEMRFRLFALDPIHPDPEGKPREERRRLMRATNDAISTAIRHYPEQWMWVHRRWRSTPESLRAKREEVLTRRRGPQETRT